MKETHKVMGRHSLTWLMAAISIIAAVLVFNSCDDDYYTPGPGWDDNYFYDTRLVGVWQLTQYNSQPVTQYDTNYLDFYGGGRGEYYFYQNSRPYSEDMSYFCQYSGNTSTDYQINVRYGSGSASTMTYWFTDNGRSLWMQWLTGNQTQTYIYTKVSAAPW